MMTVAFSYCMADKNDSSLYAIIKFINLLIGLSLYYLIMTIFFLFNEINENHKNIMKILKKNSSKILKILILSNRILNLLFFTILLK